MFKVFVNFKTYPQGSGEKAVLLARICEQVSQTTKIDIIPIVQASDVYPVKQAVNIPIWVQHLDSQGQGAFTGWQNLENLIKAGASGSLLSHSEHPLPPGLIKQVISRVKKETNFETMICCKTLGQMKKLIKLKPNYLGYEIPSLIGGEVSVTQANSEQIKHGIEICGSIPLIVGSGIHQAQDLVEAKALGASGVLISAAIVLAKDQQKKLLELLSLLKEV
jgi:triosephosphate isomerase